MARHRKLILITPGDPDGIGPEIVWKTFRSSAKARSFASKYPDFVFVCVGAKKPFQDLGATVVEVSEDSISSGELVRTNPRKFPPGAVLMLSAPTRSPSKAFLPGFQAGWAIEKATGLIQRGSADALVTGPISKERLQKGGFRYSGHTDFLADLCGTKAVTMMLANDKLRISLVTVHIGIKDVPKALTRNGVRTAVLHTVEQLQKGWGIRNPKVAVTALNPHAGESGLFGDEEIRIITPEIRSLQRDASRRKYRLEGPLPADTLFAQHMMSKPKDRYDAVVCMYHDQGLIPVKLLDFPRTVNVTLGLPIVRTSVDHGVAFDIAGQNKADPSSLQSAIALAIETVRKRK